MCPVRRWTGVGGLIVAAGLAASAPAAWAASAWLAPLDISAPRANASQADVAMNPAGDSIMAWRRAGAVQAVVRPAGGSFSERVDLTPVGESVSAPQVAIDDAGGAVVVWQRSNAATRIVQAAVRPAGGSFSAPIDLSLPGQNAYGAEVAMNQAGGAVAVWDHFNGTNTVVQAAVRPAGGSFSAPIDLSLPGQGAEGAQVALDQAGGAVAVWLHFNGTNTVVQAAVRPAGGSFSAPIDLSLPGQDTYGARVALDQAGGAVAVWLHSSGTNRIVQAAVRPAGGSFSAPIDLSAPGQDAFRAQVAIDQAGGAVALWDTSNGTNDVVQAAVRPAGGSFSAPIDLSAPGQAAQGAQVALDQAGDAVAVWLRFDGTNNVVQAAVRPAGGSFSAPVDLSAPGQGAFGPQVAMDQAGDAVAVWERFNGANEIVQAAGYDAASPQLRGLAVPATGVAGRPVSFLVAPLDVWSPLASTSWVFGDGASAAGVAPTHIYTAPGTFSVSVSATDTLANSATATRTITITPEPPSPGVSGSGVRTPRAAVTRLRLNPAAFRAAKSGRSVKAAAVRTGTRVSYAVNVATSVRFTVQRANRGRRVGRRCLETSRANRTRKRCTHFTRVPGSFTRARTAGLDRFAFTGRLAGRALRAGRYRLLATPTANPRTGTTARRGFRIIK